ncbi:MAG TPA: hypothetical protein ACFYEA_06015, partial [Candidatus Tripitaka californicus]|uniref:hypothetical protein n=2 Tax=Candidatus Tripitaka californicus TaxID=3367616 RepID=UPI004028E781
PCTLRGAWLPTVYCLLLLATPVSSETMGWAATYGGANSDRAHSIQQTTDGGYIVAGDTRSFGAGEGDAWVLKLGASGTVEWQKAYGGVNWDAAESIHEASDGGYIVAGWTQSFSAGRTTWILKLRPDGTVEWQKTYKWDDSNEARSLHKTTDGGYVVASVTSSAEGENDVWVLKLRPDGAVEWQKTYGGNKSDIANCIQQTRDGGYIVAGMTESFGAGVYDFWVLKLRSDGAVEWQKSYGGGVDDWAICIKQTHDGGYIVAGWTNSFGTGEETAEEDAWVLKLRANGTVQWQKLYGKKGYLCTASSIFQTRDGGYILAGSAGYFNTETFDVEDLDLWVLKLKYDGTVEWEKTYGGVGDERVEYLQQTGDGGYIVAGWTSSFGSGQEDIWVLKLRPDGSINPSCNFIIGNAGISGRNSHAIILDTNAGVRDSNTSPQESLAVVQETTVLARFSVR